MDRPGPTEHNPVQRAEDIFKKFSERSDMATFRNAIGKEHSEMLRNRAPLWARTARRQVRSWHFYKTVITALSISTINIILNMHIMICNTMKYLRQRYCRNKCCFLFNLRTINIIISKPDISSDDLTNNRDHTNHSTNAVYFIHPVYCFYLLCVEDI